MTTTAHLLKRANGSPDYVATIAARRVMIKRFMRAIGTTDPNECRGVFPDDWIALFA